MSDYTPQEVQEAISWIRSRMLPTRQMLLVCDAYESQAARIAELEERLEFYQGLAKERHDREVRSVARAEAAEAERERYKEALEEIVGLHRDGIDDEGLYYTLGDCADIASMALEGR